MDQRPPMELPQTLDRPLDNTALAAYLRCETLYDLSMRQHWRSDQGSDGALQGGTLWHSVMEWHRRSQGNMERTMAECLKRHPPAERNMDDYRNLNRCFVELENYVEQYGPPTKDKFQTVHGGVDSEGCLVSPLIELNANIADPELAYPYAVKIDHIAEYDGKYYVEDYKTTSRWDSSYFRQYRTSNQMRGYCYGAEKLIGKPIAGVRINLLVWRKNDSQFEREVITYAPWQREEWIENYNKLVARLQESYRTNTFSRNFTDGGCMGKYGMCQYFGICTTRPALRQAALEVDFKQLPWNPLESDHD